MSRQLDALSYTAALNRHLRDPAVLAPSSDYTSHCAVSVRGSASLRPALVSRKSDIHQTYAHLCNPFVLLRFQVGRYGGECFEELPIDLLHSVKRERAQQ